MISRWEKKKKPIYLYDMDMNFIQEFKTTDDFSDYCGYTREYIYHNLKYCNKIRIKDDWCIIKREKVEVVKE